MKFFIKDFFSKCDQIRSFLRIWSHLLKKSLMENFFFCAVMKSLQDLHYKLNTGMILIEMHESFHIITNSTSQTPPIMLFRKYQLLV